MKFITIVGISGSGKTTAAEAVIAGARGRGLRVASVKYIACGRQCHHHQGCKGCKTAFTIDKPGSNSYRHRQAGSQLVITRAAAETAIMLQQELPLSRLLGFFAGFDLVVLEGDYTAPVPRIVTAWEEADAAERLTEQAFAVSGRAAAGRDTLLGLPALDVTTAPGAAALTKLALQKAAPWPGMATPRAVLRDGAGRELPLPEGLEEKISALLAGAEIPAGGELTIRLPGEGAE